MDIDPWDDNMVATFGETLYALATPTMKGVIIDTDCSIARVLSTPGNLSRKGRDSTTPRNCNVAVRPPRDNGTVLIGGIVVPSNMGIVGAKTFSIYSNPCTQA